MTPFTDEDLKRLKNYIETGFIDDITFEDVEAIINRLEAAEAALGVITNNEASWREFCLVKEWRQSKGEK